MGQPVHSKAAEGSDFHMDADTQADVFSEVTTQKKKRVVEASPTFTDITTKKGKNLRDLETEPLPAPSVARVEAARTPPPVQLFAQVGNWAESVPVRASLGEPPTLPNPPSSFLSGLESGPSVTFDSDARPSTPPPTSSGSFAEVAEAMSTVAPTSSPTGSAPAAVVPVMSGAYAVPSTEVMVRKSVLGEGAATTSRSGFKYIVAIVVLVALVILLVVLGLRPDGSKAPAPSREPPKEVTVVAPEPAEPAEEPAVGQAGPGPERPGGGTRSATKHVGPVVRTRSVGPVERPVPTVHTQPSKPAKGDSARPNPFGESVQAVSQEKISAVVRDKNNQGGLRSCYDRALKMDNRLTSGRMDVTVSIAPSGIVKSVVVNAPSAFIMLEPCIKLAVRRWRFPANFEEYGTNFPLIMQGGM
jgi:hypothetical protein